MLYKVFFIFFTVNSVYYVCGGISSAIPQLLFDCYRSNFSFNATPPLTVPILVELIRKIEINNQNELNLRLLTTTILHRVMFDGIIKVRESLDDTVGLPYRARGDHFNKYKLIVDFLAAGESTQLPLNALSKNELCFMHKMVSSTVNLWQRGDESSTCIDAPKMPLNSEFMGDDREHSACPIKYGNMKTRWGTVSPGHIIAGIASALDRSEATFGHVQSAIEEVEANSTTASVDYDGNTDSDSVWISTVAGDLASVILNRFDSRVQFGTDGYWNDTLLPQIYYLRSDAYHLTEAEILGGIDALSLAQNVDEWNRRKGRLRLSQLIDMYYSDQGIAYDKLYRANNRFQNLQKFLSGIELWKQVEGTAKLLQGIHSYKLDLNEKATKNLSKEIVESFKTISEIITKKYDSVESFTTNRINSPIEIIMIIDGTFNINAVKQMISYLSESIQISQYNSRLGLIDGETGRWIANVTGSLFQIYTDLYRVELTTKWPSQLHLGQSLETVMKYYENQTSVYCSNGVTKPIGRIILIISSDGRLTDVDLTRSENIVRSIKTLRPEVGFVLVAPVENSIKELTSRFRDNDFIITPTNDVTELMKNITKSLTNVTVNIFDYYCKNGRMEDYITPDIETLYQIRKEYIEKAHITTKFSNSNYGNLNVCASGRNEKVCKALETEKEIEFKSEDFCGDIACNLKYYVSVNHTNYICAEDDCRYPHQVRLTVTWSSASSRVISTYNYIIIPVLAVIYSLS